MTTYDAVLLAVAVGALCAPNTRWWFAAGTPFVVFLSNTLLERLGLQQYQAPLAAMLACVLAPGYAPAALMLALADYRDVANYALATLLWPSGLILIRSLEMRFDDNTVPRRLRGAPIRLFACAILYFALLPFSYL